MDKTRLLYLVASPAGEQPEREIDVDADYDAIQDAIDAVGATDCFELRRVWGVRPEDLIDQLGHWRPNIVHFSGHGSRGRGLVFTNDLGHAVLASPAGLTGIFRVARNDDIRLAVLMTCYGLPLARALAPHVQVAIGIEDRLADDAATVFNRAFYSALAGGRSIQEAYSQGYARVRFCDGIHARNRPELAVGPRADVALALVRKRATRTDAVPPPLGKLGREFLTLRLYGEAAARLREALRNDKPEADLFYGLALALLAGRRPSEIPTLDRIREVESLVRNAIALSSKAHYYYLWAWLKSDFYVRNGLYVDTPPTVSDLVKLAQDLPADQAELATLCQHIPSGVEDDPVVVSIRNRRVGPEARE